MRKVKIQYRLYKPLLVSKSPKNLENLIRSALNHEENGAALRDKSGLRRMDYDEAVMILNRCDEEEKWIFGELAVFKPGEHIKVIEGALDQRIVNFEQINTPEGRHLLRGVTYWLIVENHLLVIQASNVSINSMQKYFTWLLYTKSAILTDALQFDAQIEIEEHNAPPVDKIEIRPKGLRGINKQSAQVVLEKGEYIEDREKISEENQVWSLLTTMGFGEVRLDKLREKAGEDGEVLLDLSIKIKNKGKIVPLLLADIASLVSEIDEDEIILHSKNGKKIGKLMMLSYPNARVEEKSSLLIPDDARRVLIEAYKLFVSNKYIENNIEI